MKTLVLYELQDDLFFFELNGDYSYLNGVYVGSSEGDKLEDELYNLVWSEFSENAKMLVKRLEKPTKDWDIFIRCGEV